MAAPHSEQRVLSNRALGPRNHFVTRALLTCTDSFRYAPNVEVIKASQALFGGADFADHGVSGNMDSIRHPACVSRLAFTDHVK